MGLTRGGVQQIEPRQLERLNKGLLGEA
ncbi:MAG: hypothetical protein U0992_04545 [Planctomycetaceae bacterium]